jgi:hypothetical protein
MWLAPSMAKRVTSFDQTNYRRAQWAQIGGLLGGELGILNVYAANSIQERCALWEKLLEVLPRNSRCIMIGHCDFVEN